MCPKELQPDVILKKSPFLVVKKLDDDEVRVFSKLHGNLTTYNNDVNEVLKLFDTPMNAATAVNRAAAIHSSNPSALIRELYEKRFLVEEGKKDKDIFLEYVETVREKKKFPKISKVTFLTSAKCNLACKGCYHHFFDFTNTDMNIEFASQILEGLFPYLKKREIPALLISFLGYEPLLNFETLSRIYDRACRLSEEYGINTFFKLFTNAFRLNEKIFNWMERNKSNLEMMVSLDGIKEDNDKRRVDSAGRGTYDKVIENLKRIIATDIECRVITVLSKLNLSNIEKFVDEMAAVGVKGIAANIFCGHSEEERQIELTEAEKFEAIKRMDLATEKYGIEFDGEWKFAVVQMVPGAHFSCPAGIKQLVFSADGVIYPCQRFAGTTLNFGSYDKDFWEKLIDGQCSGYNQWTADLYDSGTDRTNEAETDLTGWSCPFVPFMRGECLSKNFDRELNANLLEYYLSRPLNRILTKSPINY
jgi:radical SAM protein with 4Fe4S-binding SPASM domain